ncbi:MAG: hypothetical protein U9P10_08385 [Thermodesulfobacteriota bacterium]|nr:hypothetical protein [Thermodesulfobacteriota bacterium]
MRTRKRPGTDQSQRAIALPDLLKDAGDSNRTSPFAFTGNRFEFRSVGSEQSVAGSLVAMNTIFADSLDYIATRLETAVQKENLNLKESVLNLIKDILDTHHPIIFNGDNYTQAWQEEAARRGLPNRRTTPEALPVLMDADVVEMFSKYKVLSREELESRYETYLEQYILKIGVEAKTTVEMAKTIVYPAAVRYQSELADFCMKSQALGLACDDSVLKDTLSMTGRLAAGLEELETLMDKEHTDALSEAEFCCSDILPAMDSVRQAADRLESLVADDIWDLPTYQEMLFIK